MVKRKTKQVVGSNNIVRTAIPKELDRAIIRLQIELSQGKNKPVSKQWAALQLSIQWNKNKNDKQ